MELFFLFFAVFNLICTLSIIYFSSVTLLNGPFFFTLERTLLSRDVSAFGAIIIFLFCIHVFSTETKKSPDILRNFKEKAEHTSLMNYIKCFLNVRPN